MVKITLYCKYLLLNTNATFRLKKQFLTATFIACLLLFGHNSNAQSIGVIGNGAYIADGDATPTTTDFTDFGNTTSRNFYINNTASSGNPTLNVLAITLSNNVDFTVTTNPTPFGIKKNDSWSLFTITLNTLTEGTYTSTVTIVSDANNDGADNVWTYTIRAVRGPEINMQSNATTINDGDTTPTTADNTDFGSTTVGAPITKTFTIQNTGNTALSLTGASPYVVISGANASDFSVTAIPAASVASSGSTTFNIRFNPASAGVKNATLSIANNDSDENPYDFNIQGTAIALNPEIKVLGGTGSIEIVDGDTTPNATDDTDFGSINTGNVMEHTFTIDNTAGIGDLTISSITLSNTTDFAITGTSYSSPVAAGGTTTFSITYTATTIGTQVCTVTVNNDDSNEGVYDFVIQGTAIQGFFDSDNDGVFDNVDIDDDNDGILDTFECDNVVNPPLLNVDFEDLDILTLDGGATDVVATTGIWKGDATHIPNWLSADATNNYLEIWHNTQEASNDTGGQAYSGSHWAEVNATTSDGLYQDVVSTPGDVLQWTFAHRKRTGYAGSATEDVVRLMIGDATGTLVSQGDFTSAGDSSWTLHFGSYVVPAGQTSTRLTFTVVSTASGSTSSGNFIDNVQLFVIPGTCADTDGDSIPDYFDLDSDNDGIPDIVEAGFGSESAGTATLPLGSFIDTNNNGMHDAFENTTPLDSDNDGIPNYKDLDSDNDAVFDVDEARTKRYVFSTLTFENGDGDVNGDGIGNGTESEAFRAKDDDSNGILEYFGDGILDIYDYGTGANEYGNLSQGSAPYYVNNEDTADTPDYIDLDSNNDGVFDIAETRYANLDANNDGVIDDTVDSDGDGLMAAFDTNDTAFGSPRDLQGKLDLFFDGRNDYVEDTNVMSGWSESTLMAWIKINPSASGTQVIMGQDAFYIQINSNLEVEAKADGKTINSAVLSTNQWTHVAATYSNTNSKLKLYVNGEEVDTYNVSGALPADASSFTIGRQPDTNSNYFNGYIDEARVFFKALTDNELQKMVYQEIEDNNGVIKGAIIPTDITNYVDASTNTPLVWTNLKRYYRMDAFKDNVLDDLTTPEIDEGTGAKIYNTKIIPEQSAPLPFVTQQSGRLETAVNIPEKGINGDDALNPSAIVKIQHNDVYIDSNLKQVGLIIDEQDAGSTPIAFKVKNDAELNVSYYLKLDGKIDLEGESQLVQGADSYLDITSSGTVEKDQQGTGDVYTYNYWSSPVGITSTAANNTSYTLPNILKDGANPAAPAAINFISSGYDGTSTSPIGIADYWIWKFANQPTDDYSSWQHVRSTGTINPGEGFTMKGPGSGGISFDQNYVFNGKPNNGDINLTINAGNDYLVGNPYPSAIDAYEFINDNSTSITGTLYFWEHWGGGSHNLAEYQGGYHLLNLSGATTAATLGSNDPDVGTGGIPVSTPGNYIPVSQGFFVVADSDGGTINFKNSQRIFHKESSGNSTFVGMNDETSKTASNDSKGDLEDNRLKLRIGFNSVNTIRRQLLTTVDANATANIDFGYDGKHNEAQMDDMFWLIQDERFVIQGINAIDEQTVLPLGIYTKSEGLNSIVLDELEFAPEGLNVYLHDKTLDIYHDLKESSYDIFLPADEYLDRFEITFTNRAALSMDEYSLDSLDVHYSNAVESIVLINPIEQTIKSIEIINVLGQKVTTLYNVTNDRYKEIEVKNLSSGTYIIKLNTPNSTVSKKVLVD